MRLLSCLLTGHKAIKFETASIKWMVLNTHSIQENFLEPVILFLKANRDTFQGFMKGLRVCGNMGENAIS